MRPAEVSLGLGRWSKLNCAYRACEVLDHQVPRQPSLPSRCRSWRFRGDHYFRSASRMKSHHHTSQQCTVCRSWLIAVLSLSGSHSTTIGTHHLMNSTIKEFAFCDDVGVQTEASHRLGLYQSEGRREGGNVDCLSFAAIPILHCHSGRRINSG
jgi:hypothetical protein